MRAVVLERVGELVLKELEKPQCPPDGILIKVKACAVCGTDVKIFHHGHRMIRPPRVMGHEVAGVVEEVGWQVEGYKVGDRVAVAPAVPCGECHYCRIGAQTMCDELTAIGYHYDGGFAEYMVVPPVAVRNGCVNIIPDNVSFQEAAIAEPLACCINGQELSGVKLGDTVVVIGAGPIGCFHSQLAHAKGATKVILVDISAERLEMAKTVAGADIYVDSSKEDALEIVMRETEGRGADVVIVACSSGKAQEAGLEMVAKRGNINFFGGLPKDNPYINFNSNILHYRESSAVGTHGSAPRHNKLALQLIASGKINAKGLITHTLPLEDVKKGIEITEQGKGLKVIIEPERAGVRGGKYNV